MVINLGGWNVKDTQKFWGDFPLPIPPVEPPQTYLKNPPKQIKFENHEKLMIKFCRCIGTYIYAHNEAQIVNFRRWSSIPDVHFCPELRVLDSQSSILEYTIHGYK